MLTQARIEKCQGGWCVYVYIGGTEEKLGPYWWKWVAELVCWLEDGIH